MCKIYISYFLLFEKSRSLYNKFYCYRRLAWIDIANEKDMDNETYIDRNKCRIDIDNEIDTVNEIDTDNAI